MEHSAPEGWHQEEGCKACLGEDSRGKDDYFQQQEDVVQSACIVVGLSQHGKTALIDALLRGQGLDGVCSEDIGNGNVRCTTDSALYALHAPGSPTCFSRSEPWQMQAEAAAKRSELDASQDELVDPLVTQPTSEGIDAAESRKLWHLWKNDQDYKADVCQAEPVCALCKGSHMGKPIQFQILDTPGLEDSHGGDIDNMGNVIESLTNGDVTYISALVMIVRCGAPFSPAWKRQFGWYWRQFPQLHSQWVFVHTNADPIGFNAKERHKRNSCFERECGERRQQMLDAIRDVVDADLEGLVHIFAENFVPSNEFGMWEPGQEALRHYQSRVQNQLYNVLARFPIIPLGAIPLVKGPDMMSLDALMNAHLGITQEHMTLAFQETCEALRVCLRARTDLTQQRNEAMSTIGKKLLELKEKDTQDLHLVASRTLHAKYAFWKHFCYRPRVSGKLTCSHKVRSRKVVSAPTCAAPIVEDDRLDCESPESWFVTVRGRVCRSIQCDMLAYTYGCDMFSEEIGILRSEIGILSKHAENLQHNLSRQEEIELRKRNQQAAIEAQLCYCREMSHHLSRNLSLAEYCSLKKLYKDARGLQWSAQQCCAELGSVLQPDPSLSVSPWTCTNSPSPYPSLGGVTEVNEGVDAMHMDPLCIDETLPLRGGEGDVIS